MKKKRNHFILKIMLCPVRCFSCNEDLQPAYIKYCELIRQGKSKKEALDNCGLPLQSTVVDTKNPWFTLPSICCRTTLMCNIDNSTIHNAYQFVVIWQEGHGYNNNNSPSTTAKTQNNNNNIVRTVTINNNKK